MAKNCVLCKGSGNKVVFREFDTAILKCTNCGHVFSSYGRAPDYDGYFGYAPVEESADLFWPDEAHKVMYDDFCRRFIVGRNGRLLDAGCGLGFFLKRMSDFRQWEASGCEISQAAVDFAKDVLGLRNVFSGKAEDLDFRNNSFDIITLWDVIEHISDPAPLLSHLRTLLKNDGVLFIHTPNIEVALPVARLTKLLFGMKANLHYLEAKDHLNLYSVRTISALLYNSGFHSVEFIHLRPIQSVAGSRSRLLKFVKNLWFYLSVILFKLSFGRINLDNLFVVARK